MHAAAAPSVELLSRNLAILKHMKSFPSTLPSTGLEGKGKEMQFRSTVCPKASENDVAY